MTKPQTKKPIAPFRDPPEPAKTQADRIIVLFGGVRALARLTAKHGREIPPTTISGWRIKGYVPAEHHGHLLRIAWDEKLAIYPTDFNPWPPAEVQSIKRHNLSVVQMKD